jgi:hypothetical protein
MDHVARGKAVPPGDLCVARRAPAEVATFDEELGPSRAMDGSVDTAAAQQRRIRGVDDRVDIELGDVGEER